VLPIMDVVLFEEPLFIFVWPGSQNLQYIPESIMQEGRKPCIIHQGVSNSQSSLTVRIAGFMDFVHRTKL
jgi:hypothetical protein